jgi:MATE family multidrug resistance protein
MARSHDVFRAWRPDFRLMRRLMAYGSPGGLQRFMDLAAFTFFAFIIGRLGELYLAANNIVFSIEAISFFPIIGGGAAISILVGQSIGRGRPEEASQAVVSGIGISSLYAAAISLLFLLWPGPLLELFLADHYDQATRARILELGTVLLRFVVAYTIFDGLCLCCLGALSGAGDVWFPMAAMAVSVFFCLMLPIQLLFSQGWANVYSLWSCFVLYVLVITGVGAWRYRQGRWRFMQVIETRSVS